MSEENKAQVRRFIEELWHKGNLDIIDEACAPDLIFHKPPPGIPSTREGFKQFAIMYRTAFPDMHITVEDMIAEGDRLVVRYSVSATHKGELMGIPSTNKQITVSGIAVVRIAGGKIVERWEEFDALGMMQQLGVVPPGAGQVILPSFYMLALCRKQVVIISVANIRGNYPIES